MLCCCSCCRKKDQLNEGMHDLPALDCSVEQSCLPSLDADVKGVSKICSQAWQCMCRQICRQAHPRMRLRVGSDAGGGVAQGVSLDTNLMHEVVKIESGIPMGNSSNVFRHSQPCAQLAVQQCR